MSWLVIMVGNEALSPGESSQDPCIMHLRTVPPNDGKLGCVSTNSCPLLKIAPGGIKAPVLLSCLACGQNKLPHRTKVPQAEKLKNMGA